MARVRNEEEYIQKKEQIIMEAIDLLVEIGYENFSINKVISRTGMTKGAFFHYFSSKDELVKGLVEKIINPMVFMFEKIAGNPHYSPTKKMEQFFYTAAEVKDIGSASMKELVCLLHKSENSGIMHMITNDLIRQCVPIYEKVIKEGAANGEFSIENPHGVAFFFLYNVIILNHEIGKVLYGEVKDKNKWSELKEKLLAFEKYAKFLFGFENETYLYPDDVYKVIEAHL